MIKEVLLSSTLHDPESVFKGYIKPVSDVVLSSYRRWVINVTNTTDQGIKDEIASIAGVHLTETSGIPLVPDKVENDHLYLLQKTV